MQPCKDTDWRLLLTSTSHAHGLDWQQASQASHPRDRLYQVSTTAVRLSLCSMTGELPAAQSLVSPGGAAAPTCGL